MALEERFPRQRLFRLARRPDPWNPPDWSRVHDDGTFGNRFDDPDRYYRVLYASSQRPGCYLETLARFRKPVGIDEKLAEELAQIEGEDDFVPIGHVPLDWFGERRMGSAIVEGRFADIYAAEWVGYLRKQLVQVAHTLGIQDIDVAILQCDSPRLVTQRASRVAWAMGFDGVFYSSRFGSNMENWAIFEPFSITDKTSEELRLDDPDLEKALAIHTLAIYRPPF